MISAIIFLILMNIYTVFCIYKLTKKINRIDNISLQTQPELIEILEIVKNNKILNELYAKSLDEIEALKSVGHSGGFYG